MGMVEPDSAAHVIVVTLLATVSDDAAVFSAGNRSGTLTSALDSCAERVTLGRDGGA